jgi:hypothetical protein
MRVGQPPAVWLGPVLAEPEDIYIPVAVAEGPCRDPIERLGRAGAGSGGDDVVLDRGRRGHRRGHRGVWLTVRAARGRGWACPQDGGHHADAQRSDGGMRGSRQDAARSATETAAVGHRLRLSAQQFSAQQLRTVRASFGQPPAATANSGRSAGQLSVSMRGQDRASSPSTGRLGRGRDPATGTNTPRGTETPWGIDGAGPPAGAGQRSLRESPGRRCGHAERPSDRMEYLPDNLPAVCDWPKTEVPGSGSRYVSGPCRGVPGRGICRRRLAG